MATHLPDEILARYEVRDWRNGLAILGAARPDEWQEILAVLGGFTLLRSDILKPGGSKSLIANRIDGQEYQSPTHSVDCFKNRVALEVEWNNKDPFYDRDLNNFRLLFDLRAIDVGVIITRSTALQAIFNELGRGPSYGNSTTHMSKLIPRLEGGGGGGCPVVAFGIRREAYIDDGPAD